MKTETIKHTPGPWIVGFNGSIITQERTGPCSHEIIANMPAWFAGAAPGHVTQDHFAANAKLISAAPCLAEMVEALRDRLIAVAPENPETSALIQSAYWLLVKAGTVSDTRNPCETTAT